jgi:hypothetical protein
MGHRGTIDGTTAMGIHISWGQVEMENNQILVFWITLSQQNVAIDTIARKFCGTNGRGWV